MAANAIGRGYMEATAPTQVHTKGTWVELPDNEDVPSVANSTLEVCGAGKGSLGVIIWT